MDHDSNSSGHTNKRFDPLGFFCGDYRAEGLLLAFCFAAHYAFSLAENLAWVAGPISPKPLMPLCFAARALPIPVEDSSPS